MYGILNSLLTELNLSYKDPAPTLKVSRFFKLLKDSEEELHEHTNVSILAFVASSPLSPSTFSPIIVTMRFYNCSGMRMCS
jgi:hypothetical protein